MKDKLEKILTFDKRNKEKSEMFDTLMGLFSSVEDYVETDEIITNEELFNTFDSFLEKILSGILDDKITVAHFSKLVKEHNLYDIDPVNYIALLNENTWSNLNNIVISNLTNNNRVVDKKTDFVAMILFGTLKEILIPSKALLQNDLYKSLSVINKFYLLYIFKTWKDEGYLNSTNVDIINVRNVSNRYVSTCRTALYNLYERFTENAKEKNKITITNNLPEKYGIELIVHNDNKTSAVLHQLRFVLKFNIYDKYRKTFNYLSTNVFDFGSRFRMNNYLGIDVEILDNFLFLSANRINVDRISTYSYGTSLDGKFRINLAFNNAYSYGISHFNNLYGIIGNNKDVLKGLVDVPRENFKSIIKLYNKFGYTLSGIPENLSNEDSSAIYGIETIYNSRNCLYNNLSLIDLSKLYIPNNYRSRGREYNCINNIFSSIFNNINIIKIDLSYDYLFVQKLEIFMPFLYFMSDMNHILVTYSGFDYGAFSNRLFVLSEEQYRSDDRDTIITEYWKNILSGITKQLNTKIVAYDNFGINIVCNLYRIYLQNLDFDIDKEIINNKYIFFIHFNQFIKSIISFIEKAYEDSEVENIISFASLLYINKALIASNIIKEE